MHEVPLHFVVLARADASIRGSTLRPNVLPDLFESSGQQLTKNIWHLFLISGGLGMATRSGHQSINNADGFGL